MIYRKYLNVPNWEQNTFAFYIKGCVIQKVTNT